MKKRHLICISVIIVMMLSVAGCGNKPKAGGTYAHDEGDEWMEKFDLTLPDVSGAGVDKDNANVWLVCDSR